MISGHLCSKNGKWYAILGVYDSDGKRKNKWVDTGFEEKGNKRKAEAIMQELRSHYSYLRKIDQNAGKMLFCDYMLNWLESMESRVSPNTYYYYRLLVKNQVCPYFGSVQMRC